MDFSTISIPGGITWMSSIVLFVVSLLYCYNKGCPRYLRSFPIYCFVNLLPELIVALHPAVQDLTYFAFTIFEFSYFSFFLSKLIRRSVLLGILWSLVTLYFVLIGYFLVKTRIVTFGEPEAGEALILLFPCLVYYIQIFTERSTIALHHTPSFWIVTGILFNMVLLFPTLLVYWYYLRINRPQLAHLYSSMNSLAVIISYCLYAKGITCWKTKRSTYSIG